MQPSPAVVPPSATVEHVLALMTASRVTSVLVADEENGLIGIFTEKDVTRRVALRCAGSEPISSVMTAPVHSAQPGDYLYHAIARMRRFGHRHMPVTGEDNRPIGLIDLHDALAVASEQVMGQIDLLTQEGTLDGLREIKAVQLDLAEQLFADALPAPEIQTVLTHINNGIYHRMAAMCLSGMEASGWGAPPVGFDVIVMGSSGRGENFLFPDQDNGFILEDYPDGEHNRIDGFFIELAERMTRALDGLGFPLCRGNVMATNPLWRKTLPQWLAQTTLWFQKQTRFVLQLTDIFFDFQPVHGKGDLARSLRRHITQVKDAPIYLRALHENEADRQHVALGLFGRLRREWGSSEHRGKVNLKYGGLMPLVSSVRLLSLRGGVEATSTPKRLARLYALGALDRDEHDELGGAFELLTRLLLRQQLDDCRAGRKVGAYVAPGRLSRRERKLLRDSLQAIRRLQQRLRMEFTGHVF